MFHHARLFTKALYVSRLTHPFSYRPKSMVLRVLIIQTLMQEKKLAEQFEFFFSKIDLKRQVGTQPVFCHHASLAW